MLEYKLTKTTLEESKSNKSRNPCLVIIHFKLFFTICIGIKTHIVLASRATIASA